MSLFKKTKIFLTIFVSVVIINNVSADNTVGLILNDESQSFNGYTLFAPNLSNSTYLIDNNGNLVNKWESEKVPGISVYLLEDGSLLRATKLDDPTGSSTRKGGFEVRDWDNNLIWSYYYGTQHHDVEYLPNGNVLMVVTDRQNSEPAIKAGRDPSLIDTTVNSPNIRSTTILEIMKTGEDSGEIVWQWNAWDHLVQDFDQTKDNFGVVADHPELIDVNFAKDGSSDWLHTNSVAYNEAFDQIIISNRGTNEVWIIDHSTTTEQAASHTDGNSGKGGDLLYRWGNPIAYGTGTEADQKLFGQHDAHWIGSGLQGEGNILIFNNGIPDRGFSSIEEIVLSVDVNGNYFLAAGNPFEPAEASWTYTTPVQNDFYSERFGGSQRLPNGNTLICNADSGEFFEITSADEIVWKYQNPVDGDDVIIQGNPPVGNLQVFRCYKYGADYPAFIGKNLTPGNSIELPATVSVDSENSIVNDFRLYDNFPNPFNPSTSIEFSLTEGSFVTLNVYDLTGKKIKTLINNNIEPGIHSITWDSKDDNGGKVSSGVYLYNLLSGTQNLTKKMILLR